MAVCGVAVCGVGGGCLQGYGTRYGMQEKNILGLHKTYYGLFRGVAKGGEREGPKWLEELENRVIRR